MSVEETKCGSCGHDMRGLAKRGEKARCPECGKEVVVRPPLPRFSVRHPLLFDFFLLLMPAPAFPVLAAALWRFAPRTANFDDVMYYVPIACAVLALLLVWVPQLIFRDVHPGWLVWHSVLAVIGVPIASVLFAFGGIAALMPRM